ncbi:unnamed protein product, partial [Laminaria digitata]
RYPLETLPVRLEVLSALPETLNPALYASILPCCGGGGGGAAQQGGLPLGQPWSLRNVGQGKSADVANPRAPELPSLFYRMETSAAAAAAAAAAGGAGGFGG